MAVRLADTLEPMSDFPAAMGKDINLTKKDGTEKSIQKMYEDGELGGGDGLPLPEAKDKLLITSQDEESGELVWTQISKGKLDNSLVPGAYGYFTSKVRKDADGFLYKLNYNTIDYSAAKEYFKLREDITVGGCSSFRIGNYFARNYDWTYDNTVEFIVTTPTTEDNYGVVGIATGLKELDKDFVASDENSVYYKYIPFMLSDGFNSEGLAVSMNVVPFDNGTNKTQPTSVLIDEICALMLPRYLLDKFSNATEAVNFIKEHLSVYFTKTIHNMGYEIHYLVSDKSGKNLVVEFRDDSVIVLENHNVITNFYLNDVEFNADGTVYTPSTQTETENAYDTNKITLHGSGLERYNLIKKSTASSKQDIENLLESIYFTKAYQGQDRYTDFVEGDLTVKSAVSEFSSIITQAEEEYNKRDRDNPKTWQSVHSVIYDLSNLTMEVWVQENSSDKYEQIIAIDTIGLEKTITSSVAVGGIKEGEVFQEGTSFTQMFSKLLEKYFAPLITFTLSPTISLYKKGTSVTLSGLSASVTKKTENIASVKFYKGSTLLEEITSGVSSGGTFSYSGTLDAITTNTTYKASVVDVDTGTVVDATKTVLFAIPFYYGIIDESTPSTLDGLTEELSTKGNKSYTFSPANQYCVFLYDSSYGKLKSITDQNNFENLQDFITDTVTIGEYSLRYYITNGKKTLSNFKFTFIF